MPRGIFRLKQVYEEQLSGEWSTKEDVWNIPSPFLLTGPAPFGYFAGGASPSFVTTVDRIDYSNDTATAVEKGPLNTNVQRNSATGNSSFGYVATGHNPSLSPEYVTTVQRINYLNDIVTALSKGPLNTGKTNAAGVGNENFGYFVGGSPAPSAVDRIDYANDIATASPRGNLSQSHGYTGATGNQNFGYVGGGHDGSVLSSVDRIDYSNDTATAVAKGPLSVGRQRISGTSNASFGYFGGGHPGPFSTVDRVDYSNDTAAAAVKGPLSTARYDAAGVSPQANGITSPTLFPASSVRENVAPQGTDFGYFGGGNGPSLTSIVDRIDYSNDTATALAKVPLSVARYGVGATGNSSFGYFGGGGPAVLTVSTVDRIDYSNDTGTTPTKGPLSLARGGLAATSAGANANPQ